MNKKAYGRLGLAATEFSAFNLSLESTLAAKGEMEESLLDPCTLKFPHQSMGTQSFRCDKNRYNINEIVALT